MVVSTPRIVTAPRSRAEVVRVLNAQLGPTRVQPGCLRCDLYRDVDNQGAITLVEESEIPGRSGFSLKFRGVPHRAGDDRASA